MNTTLSHLSRGGWVLYDARCRLCAGGARWLGGIVKRRGFQLVPLQRHWVRERLGLLPHELEAEMRVLRPDGWVVGGADAYVYLCRFIWWAQPLVWMAALPGVLPLLRRFYAWVAANRHCLSGACKARPGRALPRLGRPGRGNRSWT